MSSFPHDPCSCWFAHSDWLITLWFSVFLTAMQFGQLLTHLDTTQQMINNSLKDNNTLLTQVGGGPHAGAYRYSGARFRLEPWMFIFRIKLEQMETRSNMYNVEYSIMCLKMKRDLAERSSNLALMSCDWFFSQIAEVSATQTEEMRRQL